MYALHFNMRLFGLLLLSQQVCRCITGHSEAMVFYSEWGAAARTRAARTDWIFRHILQPKLI